MTAVAFQLPPLAQIDAEEKNELAGLIGFALTPSTSDAQLDAIASDICRHLGHRLADLARYEEARKAEIARINMHYDARRGPIDKEIAQLQSLGAGVARQAKFPGKSKSRSVAFGVYGSRKVPEKVTVTDADTLIPWLRKNYPAVVKIESTEKVAAADLKPVVLAHMKSHEGELAPGVEHIPESETYFVKAEA